MKVGIVGCGKIADDHVALIRSVPGCTIVGVCDNEPLMGAQLCERFAIPVHFPDVQSLLEQTRPDVVHVTTPPQSHFAIAKQCLEAGAHVFVEKPFTVHAGEARQLVTLAARLGRYISVHHDQQFTRPARRMREMIGQGYLGGPPVHVESYYGYDLGQASYAKALLGDRSHWVRQLPGQLLQNVISHGVSKIAEFVPTDNPTVVAHGFSSPLVKTIGEDLIDEVRVIVSDEASFTAYFTFSSQARPVLHRIRVYGSKNAIEVDHDQQTLLTIPGGRHTHVLEKLVPPYSYTRQYFRNFTTNVSRFLRRDLHTRGGSLFLVQAFYRSLTDGTPAPVSDREMILTVQIMDNIFAQVYGAARQLAPATVGQ